MSEPLSGWPLSLAVAERLGWRNVRSRPSDRRWIGNPVVGGVLQAGDFVPAYHEDEAACFRDLWPWLEARGWNYDLHSETEPWAWPDTGSTRTHYAELSSADRAITEAGGSASEAFCRAYCAAYDNLQENAPNAPND